VAITITLDVTTMASTTPSLQIVDRDHRPRKIGDI
jgi:hypothetical protein